MKLYFGLLGDKWRGNLSNSNSTATRCRGYLATTIKTTMIRTLWPALGRRNNGWRAAFHFSPRGLLVRSVHGKRTRPSLIRIDAWRRSISRTQRFTSGLIVLEWFSHAVGGRRAETQVALQLVQTQLVLVRTIDWFAAQEMLCFLLLVIRHRFIGAPLRNSLNHSLTHFILISLNYFGFHFRST